MSLKRKLDEHSSSAGQQIMTHVVHAVDYLRDKDREMSFDDIYNYLSIPPNQTRYRPALRKALTEHPKVLYSPAATGSTATFRFRPIHNVRTADELIKYLQSLSSAQGISVKELKDGWPTAITDIDALEGKGNLLVTRNKKDNTPRMVWANDPSLALHVETNFQTYWSNNIRLPADPDIMRQELEKAGLTPTSQVKAAPKAMPQRKEKRRVNRASGRSTNHHMQGVLKDYSFQKK